MRWRAPWLLPFLYIFAGMVVGYRLKEVSLTLKPAEESGPSFTFSQPSSRVSPIPGITPETYPRVDGSDSTAPLGHLLLSHALGLRGELRRVSGILSSGAFVWVGFPLNSPRARLEEYARLLEKKGRHHGTEAAYRSLIERRSDLILVERQPSPAELQAADDQGVGLDAQPFALDATVLLVNADNPITSLTLDQARGILDGRITNWASVGGAREPVVFLAEPQDAGMGQASQKPIPGSSALIQERSAVQARLAELSQRLATGRNRIAASSDYVDRLMRPYSRSRRLNIDGIPAMPDTLSDGRYPLTTAFYAVMRTGLPPSDPAARLRRWLLSTQGQRLVAAGGYVPFPTEPSAPEAFFDEAESAASPAPQPAWSAPQMTSGVGE